jgi:hypothetical protein
MPALDSAKPNRSKSVSRKIAWLSVWAGALLDMTGKHDEFERVPVVSFFHPLLVRRPLLVPV